MADPLLQQHSFTFLNAAHDHQSEPTEAPAHRHRRGSSGHSHSFFSHALSATALNTSTHSASATPSTSTPNAILSSPMPKLFKIEIANNGDCKSSSPVFYPSDLIHGMVYLYLDKPMTLPALKIVFRGESNYPSSRQQDHLDHHMRRLFSVAMTLWGSREPIPEDQWGQLPAGNHIFPFTVQLPDKNLPASFDHPWLKNQYTLTAYYRRPNGLSKWQSKAKPINFMPLSTPGLEHGPIQETCPKMGTALLLAHPDLTPGGRAHVKLTAAAAIDRCQFALSRHIRARINETTYKEDEVICHYERKSIPKGEFSLVLPIPKLTPPTTESSTALKITYSVQVSIWNERFFIKTESHNFDLPIVIRTLPSCDNRACEGLDWCEPSVDRPMFLTETPTPPLPLYDADQSPPKYTPGLPAYEQVASAATNAMNNLSIQDRMTQDQASSSSSSSSGRSSRSTGITNSSSSTPQVEGRRSTDSAGSSSSSDIEGHESRIPDHPSPHHPTCIFYERPSSEQLSRLQQTEEVDHSLDQEAAVAPTAVVVIGPHSSTTSLASTIMTVGSSSSEGLSGSPSMSSMSSSSSASASAPTSASASALASVETTAETIDAGLQQLHARAVDYLKVQTVFEAV
ncbi:hypothetical protein BGW38_005746 [Lunasporangiospora selenospora]|uniref:Arrestin-like N-terminal domain-containing protein n=1 Tax=Lunasporangiospora selenospora TaxID=979761 RepID=A0A9P6FZE6_9FUNG|nr:hypothetical protein BGW38_005746 [Lunasporangiospora selenospora]